LAQIADFELFRPVLDEALGKSFKRRANPPIVRGSYKRHSCKGSILNKDQYAIVAARRQGYDSLLWQTPALAIAAQSFLLAAAVGSEQTALLKVVFSAAAFLVGISALQLFARLRYLEVYDSRLLLRFETSTEGYAVVHGRRAPLTGEEPGLLGTSSSYHIWAAILTTLVVISAWVAIVSIISL
jgi:hypothetical protein